MFTKRWELCTSCRQLIILKLMIKSKDLMQSLSNIFKHTSVTIKITNQHNFFSSSLLRTIMIRQSRDFHRFFWIKNFIRITNTRITFEYSELTTRSMSLSLFVVWKNLKKSQEMKWFLLKRITKLMQIIIAVQRFNTKWMTTYIWILRIYVFANYARNWNVDKSIHTKLHKSWVFSSFVYIFLRVLMCISRFTLIFLNSQSWIQYSIKLY